MEIKLFTATKAFIVYNGKVLLLKESMKYTDGSNAGKFDVVGGRVKPGQRFDESLIREIQEETGLNIKIGRPFFVNEWRPIVRGEQWQIVGTFFECFSESDKVLLSEDHEEYVWIDPKEYKKYNLIDNLIPAFEEWLQFIESFASSRQIKPANWDKYAGRHIYGVTLPNGVTNTISFNTRDKGEGLAFYPTQVKQDYVGPKHLYDIRVLLSRFYLGNSLTFYPDNENLRSITVSTGMTGFGSRPNKSAVNRYDDTTEGLKWRGSQIIRFDLTEAYLDYLKGKNLLDKASNTIVTVENSEEADEGISLSSNGSPSQPKISLTDNSLRHIYNAIDFKFNFFPPDRQTVGGRLGRTGFILEKAKLDLNLESVREILAGKAPNPFIFPVDIFNF